MSYGIYEVFICKRKLCLEISLKHPKIKKDGVICEVIIKMSKFLKMSYRHVGFVTLLLCLFKLFYNEG
jgi:hypothetical protein